ncbi:MAG: carboxypeptidase-like regulatory domain-containing protein [Flavobacterium sp.]
MKYRIEIPEPCHEDWDKMTPQDKGRHCDVCDKVVVDFSKYSKRDIINHIKKEGKICGRVPRQYVGVDLEEEKIRKSFGLNGMVATMVNLLALTAVNHAVANKPESIVITNATVQNPQVSLPLLDKLADSRVIRGRVFENNIPLPGASVVLKGTKIGVSCDKEGKFTLTIPKVYNTKELTLVTSFIGMKDTITKVSSSNDYLKITLVADNIVIMGDVVVRPINKQRKN